MKPERYQNNNRQSEIAKRQFLRLLGIGSVLACLSTACGNKQPNKNSITIIFMEEQQPNSHINQNLKERFEEFKRSNQVIEQFANEAVSLYQVQIGTGSADIILVDTNNPAVHVKFLTVENARVIETKSTNPNGFVKVDTAWEDGKNYELQSVKQIAKYHLNQKVDDGTYYLRYAGHGPYTNGRSIVGTVVRDSDIEHVNPEWATLCIDNKGNPQFGRLTAEDLKNRNCKIAIGHHPIVVITGQDGLPRIATFDSNEVTKNPKRFTPFNPWSEKIDNLDERKKAYTGIHRHSISGIATNQQGKNILVFANSEGISAKDLAEHLVDHVGVWQAAMTDADTYNGYWWNGKKVEILKQGNNGTFGTLAVYTT